MAGLLGDRCCPLLAPSSGRRTSTPAAGPAHADVAALQVLAAEARARAEWEAALMEERRRAMLNASVPARVAMFLQDIRSPAADGILQVKPPPLPPQQKAQPNPSTIAMRDTR